MHSNPSKYTHVGLPYTGDGRVGDEIGRRWQPGDTVVLVVQSTEPVTDMTVFWRPPGGALHSREVLGTEWVRLDGVTHKVGDHITEGGSAGDVQAFDIDELRVECRTFDRQAHWRAVYVNTPRRPHRTGIPLPDWKLLDY